MFISNEMRFCLLDTIDAWWWSKLNDESSASDVNRMLALWQFQFSSKHDPQNLLRE